MGSTTEFMFNLGDRVKDRISGLKGIVIGRTQWLFGCERITVQPETEKDNKPAESFCIDAAQAELVAAAVIVGADTSLRVEPEQRRAGPREDATRAADARR